MPDSQDWLPHLPDDGLAEAFELAAGDVGPLAGVVELQVGFPVVDGFERIAETLA